MFKVNNRNTRTRSEICSKLKIKTTERRYWQILFSCISIAKETEKHKSGVRQKHSQPLLCQLQIRGKIKSFIFTLLYGKLLKTEVLLAIRKKFILKVSFLILNTILHFLNVYEHLAVPFVEKEWVPCGPSPFLLFTLDYLPEHFHNHTSLILLIAWNLSCYLHFAFRLFVWLIKLKCNPNHLTIRNVSGDM